MNPGEKRQLIEDLIKGLAKDLAANRASVDINKKAMTLIAISLSEIEQRLGELAAVIEEKNI